MKWLALVALGACKPLTPPPAAMMHADTAAAPVDTTTVMLVIGNAGALWGGGIGAAVRVERQVTTRTSIGGEFVGGWGSDGTEDGKRWLVGMRGFGRGTPRTHDWVAVTYGAGLSLMDVGMLSFTLHGGGAVSYPNDYVAPVLQTGLALAVPLRKGRGFGGTQGLDLCLACTEPRTPTPPSEPAPSVHTELYWFADAGAVGLIGDTGNRVSLDVGFAQPLTNSEGVYAISVADSQR